MKKTPLNPISKKRAAQIPIEKEIKRQIYDAGDGMCEVPNCWDKIADRGHEIIFRSQGGSCVDPFNIALLCRFHHDRQHGKHIVCCNLYPIPEAELLAIVRPIRERQGFILEEAKSDVG